MEPLLTLLILVVLAYVLGELAFLLKIPRVVGQILAGLLLGLPFIKVYVLSPKTAELIGFLADLGILLLFFFVGLQIKMLDIKKNIGESSLIAFFNTALPFVAGILLSKFVFGFSTVASIIVGMCLSVSSQSVTLSVLEDLNFFKSKIGKRIITAGAVDDVFELILLSVVLTLIHASVGQTSLVMLFIELALFVLVIILFRFLIIPLLIKLFDNDKSITHLFTGAIVITLLMALITNYLGIGAIVGALFAGIIVREILLGGKLKEPWEEHNIAKATHIISFGFFVPIFFVWVGLKTDLSVMFADWYLLIILFIITVVGTILGAMLGVLAHKGSLKEGFIVGWGLLPKGDVELVIATVALTQGLITENIFSTLILIAFFTTLIAPIVFRHLAKHYSVD